MLYGDTGDQLLLQLEGAAFIIIYNAIARFIILKVISVFVPLRMEKAQLVVGDDAVHGEPPMQSPWGGRRIDGVPTLVISQTMPLF